MTQLPDHYEDVGPGWRDILTRLHQRVIVVSPDYEVDKVNEHLGSLRVRLEDETPEIWGMIGEAEMKSTTTCDECGGPGFLTKTLDGRIVAKCKSHDPMGELLE